jgi:hypothetical protein
MPRPPRNKRPSSPQLDAVRAVLTSRDSDALAADLRDLASVCRSPTGRMRLSRKVDAIAQWRARIDACIDPVHDKRLYEAFCEVAHPEQKSKRLADKLCHSSERTVAERAFDHGLVIEPRSPTPPLTSASHGICFESEAGLAAPGSRTAQRRRRKSR